LTVFIILQFYLKILLFLENNLKKIKKPFSKITKGLENGQAPLTFSSWNQIIAELRNIYKLKDLINLPVSAINNV